ncbi:MAG: hypothetical protein ABWX92_02995 [Mycetocola sp.]
MSSQEAARLVLELAQTPMTGREIARITGVGRSTIARLLHAGSGPDHVAIREDTLAAIRAAHATYAHAFAGPVSTSPRQIR